MLITDLDILFYPKQSSFNLIIILLPPGEFGAIQLLRVIINKAETLLETGAGTKLCGGLNLDR